MTPLESSSKYGRIKPVGAPSCSRMDPIGVAQFTQILLFRWKLLLCSLDEIMREQDEMIGSSFDIIKSPHSIGFVANIAIPPFSSHRRTSKQEETVEDCNGFSSFCLFRSFVWDEATVAEPMAPAPASGDDDDDRSKK